MFKQPNAVRVKEELVEEFVCLVNPRRDLAEVAQPLVQVKKEEDEEGLAVIEPPVVYPSNEELAFWLGSNGDSEDEDDSTGDQATLHRPEPLPAASAIVPTSHQPAAPAHVSPPRQSPFPHRNQCSVCGKSFTRPFYLRNHHRVHTGERPFACTFPGCTKAFTQKSNLKAHERTHSNTRPFRCTWPGCKMAFTTNGSLTVHTKRHTRDLPYKCTWTGCDKAFAQSSHLTTHTRRHTGVRPYRCSWTGCSKAFAQSSYLTRHLNTHTGVRPHRCPHCPSAFADQTNLSVHLRLHSGQLPYQCQLCSKRFNRKDQLTKHLRTRKHRNQTEASNARSGAHSSANSTAPQSTVTLATGHSPPVPPSSESADLALVQVKMEIEE